MSSLADRMLMRLGRPVVQGLVLVGATWGLFRATGRWLFRSAVDRRVRFGWPGLVSQMVRVGVQSLAVVLLINAAVGAILALQMAPPLQDFGQASRVADIIAIATFRELGPLVSAIVLTGFAGAAIAAELGTMVVGEEIEALRAHALNPVRFLVMPRVLATTVSLVVLCALANVVAVGSGLLVAVTVLNLEGRVYIGDTLAALDVADFVTGLIKAGVFGSIIALVACHYGLSVVGGAAGVGRATTLTVVHSIVGIILADLLFTAMFFALGWT